MTKVLVDDIEVVKFHGKVGVRVLFNNGRGHAINLDGPVTPKQISDELVKLGMQISRDPNLKEKS